MADAQQDKTLGILAHISALVLGFIGPLIIYLIAKDKSEHARENAKHALNFQISVIIYAIICVVLMIVLIGFLLLGLLLLFNLIIVIIATIKAANGEIYSYPLEIKFLK